MPDIIKVYKADYVRFILEYENEDIAESVRLVINVNQNTVTELLAAKLVDLNLIGRKCLCDSDIDTDSVNQWSGIRHRYESLERTPDIIKVYMKRRMQVNKDLVESVRLADNVTVSLVAKFHAERFDLDDIDRKCIGDAHADDDFIIII